MPFDFRIRDRLPEKDDSYLLDLIKRNLGQYPSGARMSDEKTLKLLNQYTRIILLTTPTGKRIGFLSWKEKGNVLFLGLCVLDEAYQGTGIATHYSSRLEAFALRKGFDTIRFFVDKQNKDAYKLYKRFGFTPKFSNPLTGTILMEKKLT